MDSDEVKKYVKTEDIDEVSGISTGEPATRKSLTHEDIEQKLEGLINNYKKSLQNISPTDHDSFSRGLTTTFFPPYEFSSQTYDMKDPYISDHLILPNEASMPITLPSTSNVSLLPTFINSEVSDFPFSSSLDAHKLSDRRLKFPTDYRPMNNTSIENGNRDYEFPKLDSHANYENGFYILQSQDPINIQIDETVTFKKMLNTGISLKLSKQISFLIFELNRLNDANEQMSKELKLCKMELNSAKNQFIFSQQKGIESDNNVDASGVLQEIYRAQKMRDAAMIDRLKEVNLTKNVAMFLAGQRFSSTENDIVSSLVRSQSLDDLKASTSTFLEAIANEKEKKRIANEQEIEAIFFEKDLVHKQKKTLEHEMKLLSDKLKHVTYMRDNLQKKLIEVERERNQFFNDINFLQDKLKNLKTHENLFKSLSKEEELHHQFSHKLTQLQDELEVKDKQMKIMRQEMERLGSTLGQFNSTNTLLASKCNSMEEQLRREREQVERLNRLVEVLRRKLKEASIKIQF